jgi:hypothetical protein
MLPRTLQIGLTEQLHKHTLKKFPSFSSWLPAEAIFELSQKWQKQVFLPLDAIVNQGDAIGSICFLVRGGVTTSVKIVGITTRTVCQVEQQMTSACTSCAKQLILFESAIMLAACGISSVVVPV